MAIENNQTQTSQVCTTAVCCTADLSLEAINDFLAQVWNQEEQETSTEFTPPIHTLTLVHDLETFFWGVSRELRGEDHNTVLHSPFTGRDYPQIRELLVRLKEATGSIVRTDWFLILDERSVETSSAVIVHVEASGAHTLPSSVRSLRVDYPVSSRYLAAASVAHPPLDELREIVDGSPEKYRGILRDD